MSPIPLTPEQFDAALGRQGHEPCPGVEIEFARKIGSVSGGPELHATIFRPEKRGAGPAPALLAFHGGGWVSGDPNGYGDIAKILALSLGMITVSVSYRLVTDKKPIYPGLIEDAALAYRWAQNNAAELGIDPKKVAVSGESAGVLPAAHLAVNSPVIDFGKNENRPAALVALWGAFDFVARWYDRGENPGAEYNVLGGGYAEIPQLYHEASPITYAKGELPPAFLAYGRQDRVVHPRQGMLAHAAWKAAKAHSELLIIGNIGHNTEGDNREQRASCYTAMGEFLAARLVSA